MQTYTLARVTMTDDLAQTANRNARGLGRWRKQWYSKAPYQLAYERFDWRTCTTATRGVYTWKAIDDEIAVCQSTTGGKPKARLIFSVRWMGWDKGVRYLPSYWGDDKYYFSDGYYWPRWNDADVLADFERFLDALVARYGDHPAIHSIQVAAPSLGAEGNTMGPDAIRATSETLRRHVTMITSRWLGKKWIQVPSDNEIMCDYAMQLDERIGWYRHSLGGWPAPRASTGTPQYPGVYQFWDDLKKKYLSISQAAWDRVRFRHRTAPIIAEVFNYTTSTYPANTYPDFVRAARNLKHPTQDAQGLGGLWVGDGNIRPWANLTAQQKSEYLLMGAVAGYQFACMGVTDSGTWQGGRTITLQHTWQNWGSCRAYDNYPIMFQLRNGAEVTDELTSIYRIWTLEPGAPVTVTEPWKLKNTLPAGTYTFGFTSPALSTAMEPLRFAHGNATGDLFYALGTITVGTGGSVVNPQPDVGAATATYLTNESSKAVVLPSGIATGRDLYLSIFWRNTGSVQFVSEAVSGGYSRVEKRSVGYNGNLAVYHKRATSASDGAATVSFTNPSGGAAVTVTASIIATHVGGADTTPYDTPQPASATSTSIVAPGVATRRTNSRLLVFGAVQSQGVTITDPMTRVLQANLSGQNTQQVAWTEVIATPTSDTGTRTAATNLGTAQVTYAITIPIAPAASQTAPTPPTNLTATAVDTTDPDALVDAVDLAWTASSGTITGYLLSRRQSDGVIVDLGRLLAGATTFRDLEPPRGTPVTYSLVGINDDTGDVTVAAESNTVEFLEPEIEPMPVENVQFVRSIPNGAVISWDPPLGGQIPEMQFRVEITDQPELPDDQQVWTAVSAANGGRPTGNQYSTTLMNLTGGESYLVRMITEGVTVTSRPSFPPTLITAGAAPPAVTWQTFTAVESAPTQIDFAWTLTDNGSPYTFRVDVVFGDVGNGVGVPAAAWRTIVTGQGMDQTARSASWFGAAPNTTYTFRIVPWLSGDGPPRYAVVTTGSYAARLLELVCPHDRIDLAAPLQGVQPTATFTALGYVPASGGENGEVDETVVIGVSATTATARQAGRERLERLLACAGHGLVLRERLSATTMLYRSAIHRAEPPRDDEYRNQPVNSTTTGLQVRWSRAERWEADQPVPITFQWGDPQTGRLHNAPVVPVSGVGNATNGFRIPASAVSGAQPVTPMITWTFDPSNTGAAVAKLLVGCITDVEGPWGLEAEAFTWSATTRSVLNESTPRTYSNQTAMRFFWSDATGASLAQWPIAPRFVAQMRDRPLRLYARVVRQGAIDPSPGTLMTATLLNGYDPLGPSFPVPVEQDELVLLGTYVLGHATGLATDLTLDVQATGVRGYLDLDYLQWLPVGDGTDGASLKTYTRRFNRTGAGWGAGEAIIDDLGSDGAISRRVSGVLRDDVDTEGTLVLHPKRNHTLIVLALDERGVARPDIRITPTITYRPQRTVI